MVLTKKAQKKSHLTFTIKRLVYILRLY